MALSYSQFYYGSSNGELATFNSIRERALGIPQSDIQDVIVNFDDRHIYYCSSGNGIFRSDLNLENVSGIVNQSGCVAIDIDFNGGFLYALNQVSGSIIRHNLDGTGSSGIISSGIVNGTDLELDLVNDSLYWCERGSGVGSGLIRRLSSLGGSPFTKGFDGGFDGSVQIVVSGLSGPAGLAIDKEKDLIYFSDDVDSQIKKVAFNGGTVSGLVSGSLISSPQKLKLDISRPFGLKSFESKNLFWADKDLDFINVKSLTASTSGSIAGSGAVVSGSSPIGFDLSRRIPRIRPRWHNTCFTSRRRLSIDDANGGILNDIPIELNINVPPIDGSLDLDPILNSFKAEEFGGKVASSSGLDILLASDDGLTQIPHEIEKYSPETGELVLWALAPEVFDLQTTTLYMYYGDQDPFSDNQNPSGIWDVSHEAVWHLSQLPSGNTGEIKDSTSNAYHGTASGSPTRVSGIHGFGMEFGVGDAINIDDTFDPPQSGTLLLRFYTSGQVSGAIFGIGDGFELEILPSSTIPQPLGMTVRSRIFATGTDVLTYSNDTAPPLLPDQWNEIGVTWDISTGETRIIINGDLTPSGFNGSNQADDDPGTGQLSIGKSTEGVKPTTNFILDEVRIANRPFSPVEIRTAFRVHVSNFGDEEFEGQIYFERNEQILLGDNLRFDPPTNTTPFWLNTPTLNNIPPFAVLEVAIINADDTAALRGGVGYRDPATDTMPGVLSRGGPGGLPGTNRLIDLHDADLAVVGSGLNIYTVHVNANENGQIDGWGEQPIPFEPSLRINLIGYWTSGIFETTEWQNASTIASSGAWEIFDTNIDTLSIADDVVEIIISQPRQFDPVIVGARASDSLLERKFNLHEAPEGVDNLTLFSQAKDGIIEVFAEHTSATFIVNGWWSTPPDIYTEKYEKIGSPSGNGVWSTHPIADFLPKNNNIVIEVVLSNQQANGVNAVGMREVDSDVQRLFHLHETHDAEDGPDTQDVIRMHSNVVARSGCGKDASVPTIELYHSDTSEILNESGFIMVGVWGQPFLSDTADEFTLHTIGHLPINSGINLHITGFQEDVAYVEKFDSWFATSASTWEQKDLTPFGVPSGAVVEILITNIIANQEVEAGVREVGSSLERRFLIHEAEGGGEEGLCMHVQVNGSGYIEQYTDNTGDIKFTILGCWSGDVAYVERNDHFNASSFDEWVALDVSASGASLGTDKIVEVIAFHNFDGLEQSGGVRHPGSIIERKFKLHEAESGGFDFATFTTNSINGKVEVYSSDASMSFQLVGYWSTPPDTYQELFFDIGEPPSQGAGVFGDIDLSDDPFAVPPFAIADIALVNENGTFPLQLGVREQLSSLSRIVDVHKAERFGAPPTAQDVIRMQVAGGELSIIEASNETFANTNFKIIGYWGELQPTPISDNLTLYIQGPTPVSSGIDLYLEAPPVIGAVQYIEKFETITPTTAGSWEVQDLSGLDLPYSGVLDILVTNVSESSELQGGVRAFGSSLMRRLDIHEAEAGGEDGFVFHVQLGPDQKIETYAEDTSNVKFRILGCWDGGLHYVERFDTFNLAIDDVWTLMDISAAGADLGADKVAEVIGYNSHLTDERYLGVRRPGSLLDRRFNIHKAEGGGVEGATFLVNTSGGLVELYAESASDVTFKFIGYWEIPPTQYQERAITLPKPTGDRVWTEIDIRPLGLIQGNVVADINIINRNNNADLDLGSREVGSTLDRFINTHKAERNPSASEAVDDVIRLQTNTTAGSTNVEFYVELPTSFESDFYLLGFWGEDQIAAGNIDLFIKGVGVANSGIDLFIQNKTISDDIDLFLKNNIISDNITLFTLPHDVCQTVKAFTYGFDVGFGPEPPCGKPLTLFIDGIGYESDDITLHLENNVLTDEIDLFIIGHETVNDQIDLFIPSQDTATDDIDLFISGPIPISSDIDLFMEVAELVQDQIDLFIAGPELATSGIDLFIPAIGTASDQIDLFVQGHETQQDNITLFISGPIEVQSGIDLFISAPVAVSGTTTLFLSAQPLSTGSIDLFIQNDIIQNTTTLFTQGIAQLFRAARIYWTDNATDKIERVKINGSLREVLVEGLSNPIGLEIDNENQQMYWIEEAVRKLRRASLTIPSGETPSTRTDIEDLVEGSPFMLEPRYLALDFKNEKVYWTDLSSDTIKRANFAIPSGETPTTRTDIETIISAGVTNPLNIAIDPFRDKIYWNSTTTDDISRSNLDGSNIEVVISGLSNPAGLDINEVLGKIYFTDSADDSINRANLDGSDQEELLQGNDLDPAINAPVDIITDDINLYWGALGGGGTSSTDNIRKALLNGIVDSAENILSNNPTADPPLNSLQAVALELVPYNFDTITLHMNGPLPIENDITLFFAANKVVNDMTLFIVASGSQQSWDLFLKATPEQGFLVADDLDLILRGSASGEAFSFIGDDIDLFLQAPPEPVIEAFGLNTVDAELFLKGPFESDTSNNWQLFLKADSSTDTFITMSIQGHASGSAPAGALNSGDITLFMSNIANNPNEIGFTPIDEEWTLFLKVRPGISEQMTLSISGFIPTVDLDTPVDFFIKGFDVYTQDISFHIFGVSGILSNNIDLSIPNVIDDDDDDIELYIHGY